MLFYVIFRSLSFFNISHVPLTSTNFMTLSSLLLLLWVIHTHTHTNADLLNAFSFTYICVFVCVFVFKADHLTTWDWIVYQGFSLDLPLLAIINWLFLKYRSRTCLARFPLSTLKYQVMLSLCRFCLDNHVGRISCLALLCGCRGSKLIFLRFCVVCILLFDPSLQPILGFKVVLPYHIFLW